MDKDLKGAVFDCNVYLQAIISRNGTAAKCLALARDRRITLYTSPSIVAEIEEVLFRPVVRALIPHQSAELIESFIRGILTVSTSIHNVRPAFSFTRDPDDEPYLNLAIASGAHFLVSRDKDLLDLMTDYSDDAKDFRRRYRQISIVNPVGFLSGVTDTGMEVEP